MLKKFFTKKEHPIIPQEEKPQEQKKSEPEMITFSIEHDCFVRAQKILQYGGMYCSSDLTNRVARGVKIYMDLDSGKIPQDYEKQNK